MIELGLAATLAAALLVLLAAAGRLSAVLDELPTPGRRLAGCLLLWSVLTTCVFVPVVSPGAAADVDPATLWFPSLFAGQLLLGVFLLAWWSLAAPRSLRRLLRLEGASWDDLLAGLRVGGVGWLLAISASAAVTGLLLLAGHAPTEHADGLAEPFQVPELLLWLVDLPVWKKLVVVAVAMTVEEAFYRAYLQTRIGWVPSSALFALSHAGYGMPTLLASVFAVSLAIGWALRRYGNLVPCIVAHGAFDAVQLLVVMPIAVEQLGAR